jgi:release factor glutamine methyltransferase
VTIENGAKKITFADINPRAIENVEENIKLKNIKNYEIYESNLFQNIPDNKFDIIIFNHPFFPEDSDSYKSMERDDNLIKKSMLADVSLINRFLLDAKRYLHTDGKIIMPYFHLAGPQNDPKTYNEKY